MTLRNVTLLLGSNMGDRLFNLSHAEDKIKETVGKVIKRSKVYETASWGDESLSPFLNQVIEAETTLTPHEILYKILQMEASMGRERIAKWTSRIIDIDILFFENEIVESLDLIIPHPFLHKRRFTLVPLVEIQALKVHPVLHKTNKQLLEEVEDLLPVTEYKPPLAIK